MEKLFGTDGVRGVANVHPMTTEVAMQVGRAAAYVFKQEKHRHKILIGKDTRLSGYMIENALAAGICSMGVDVLLVGPMPTPAIAFLTSDMRADAGVVISASHNPFQDNGIKFFSRDGFKLPDHLEEKIEEIFSSNAIDEFRPTALEVGKAYRVDDAQGRYVVSLKHTFPRDLTLEGLRIVVDCANGAAYRVAPEVLYELGADVFPIAVKPDGENINRDCGSLHPEVASKEVLARGAQLGIALDGDADRAIFIDERGEIIDGDHVLAICGREMLASERLVKSTVVTTVMSNLGLDEAMKRAGGRVLRTRVGDRYVVEEMRRGGYNLGGEQSGHFIFLDHSTTGDGMVSALQVLAIMCRRGRPLSELASIMRRFPQVMRNAPVKQKPPLEEIPELARAIASAEKEIGEQGRVLVRYSGTEPLLRVMVEGEDMAQIEKLADDLVSEVERHLG